ncbi:MAG: diacylglycerol kinase family protein [Pseudomonadota bacterium]
MNLLIIANPIAGRGYAKRRVDQLAGLLSRNGHNLEIFFSEKPGDASTRAADINNYFDRIVVVGGDGTLNEVLNGLVDPSATPLVHVASGTANMLARELGIPSGISHVANLVKTGTTKFIDMGIASGRRFILVAGVGFDSFVTMSVKSMRASKLGYRGYIKPVLKAGHAYHPINLNIWVDEQGPIAGQMVMVLKTRYYGGIFVFADDARPDSGFFHIRIFPRGTRSAILKYGIMGFARKVSILKDVISIKGKKLKIEAETPAPLQLDGDHRGWTPVDIELIPAAVPIIVPAGRAGSSSSGLVWG